MEGKINELAGKVAKLKIAFSATEEEIDLFRAKYAGQESELVWSEMEKNISFSYESLAVGAGNTPVVILHAKFVSKSDVLTPALGACKVH